MLFITVPLVIILAIIPMIIVLWLEKIGRDY